MTVYYLGPEGSHSHQVVLQNWPHKTQVPCSNISQIFHTMKHSETEIGLVPLENSTHGSVSETLDSFVEFPELCFVGSTTVPIQHHLMSNSTDLKDIKEIWSHPQGLGQCREWLYVHTNSIGIDKIPCSSTSKAAQLASTNPSIGAICNISCAQIYSLNIIAENIQDLSNNQTTFVFLTHAHLVTWIDFKIYMILLIVSDPSELSRALLNILGSVDYEVEKMHSRPCASKGLQAMSYFIQIRRKSTLGIQELMKPIADLNIRILGSFE